MEEIKVGDKYVHYKNKEHIYEIIGLAKSSETLEDLVIYKALYDSKEFGYGVLWVRPLKMFLGDVIIDGEKIRRFRKNN